MLQRHVNSNVLGGAYVFPGGKLDAADAQLEAPAHLDAPAEQLQSALAEEHDAIDASDPSATPLKRSTALFVAALRETFEECGVLMVENARPDQLQAALQQRANGIGFNPMLHALQLRLQCTALHPWSRWITPRTSAASIPRQRFDTRFFVAAMPAGQHASHDMHETTASVWLTPHQALLRYWDQHIDLVPPQIMTLSHLARFTDVASVLAYAHSTPPPLILPEAIQADGELCLCYPGDPRHSVRARAMPGPTRLYLRNKRFEPMDGIDGLLSPTTDIRRASPAHATDASTTTPGPLPAA